MGVFAIAASQALFRDATVVAAHDLGWFDALAAGPRTLDALADAGGIATGRHRVRALVDALVSVGVLARSGDAVTCRETPPCPPIVREGWGRLAEVIRTDRPLALPADPTAYHQHLLRAGADSAREVAQLVAGTRLLDLGGGAGAYTAAVLDADPNATATLVDAREVIALARDHLARFGDRVQLVAGDARAVEVDGRVQTGADDARAVEMRLAAPCSTALLANVLHLHGPDACAELVAVAARATEPGGRVAIVELSADAPEAPWFALDMALYTERGDVYAQDQLRGWLADAGLIEIETHALIAAPENVVVVGRTPRGAGRRFAERTGLAAAAAIEDAQLGDLAFPAPLRLALTHALALERSEGSARVADLVRHYTESMPAQREAQRTGTDPLLHTPFVWAELPRLSRAIDRLFAVLVDAGVDPQRALGAATAEAFRATTPTLAVLYARSHYGAVMPLLYGNLADLAYFRAHGGGLQQAIDRYLTTPILHELCHLASDRDALQPLHLDECVAGWLGVHVHPEFAYPEVGHDDAIFAAPWLSQIGQAFARAFGIRAVISAHAGARPWDAALPAAFVDAAIRLGWEDWCARRTLHFLSNTLDPTPWVALALAVAAGRDVRRVTLAEIAATTLSELTLPSDPAFDRAIVEDAVRAMCLENFLVEGSFRARTKLPDGPIAIDARLCAMTSPRRGTVDIVDPRYWIPPAVGQRILAAGRPGYTLTLATLEAIPAAASAIDAAAPPGEYAGFRLG